jgi:dCMP deaminase
MRKRVYVSCPISRPDTLNGLYHNIAQADRASAELMRRGYSFFNPALSCYLGGAQPASSSIPVVHAVADRHANDEFQQFAHGDWLDMDFAWVAASDAVLRLPGESTGADAEVKFAESLHIPVFTSIDTLDAHFKTVGSKSAGLDLLKVSKWDRRFLELAEQVGGWSKDESTQVGAVIADGKRVVSVGFNGFAQGCDDSSPLYRNRELKLKRVVHAEVNAILFAGRPLTGCTLYVFPFMPCAACAAIVIQAGITRVVAPECPKDKFERWKADMVAAMGQFAEADVKLELVPWL